MNRKRLLSEMEKSSAPSKVRDDEKIKTPAAPASSLREISQQAKPAAQSSRDDVGSPSAEASHDPAPTRHEPVTDEQRVNEKSKYEASEKFRPMKGNRLS